MNYCTCGRPINAGRTAGTAGNTQCLICWTEAIMQTLPEPKAPPKKASQARATTTAKAR